MTDDRPWKLDVDLVGIDKDFTIAFDSRQKAQTELDNIAKRGYVIQDLSDPNTGNDETGFRVDCYPLGQVRSLRVRYRTGISGAPPRRR